MYKADSHIHSNFSGDSVERLENIAERAIELGMDEITITDHLDLDYADGIKIFELDVPKYIETLKKLKETYRDRIKIKIGVELGLQPQLVRKYDGIFNCEDIDFINRYGKAFHNDYREINFELHKEIIDQIFIKLIKKNIGIELNTSGLRYGLKDFHPCRRNLERYKELGGKIITMGSDAHKASDIMKDFNKAREELKEIGFEKFCTFEKRKVEYRDL